MISRPCWEFDFYCSITAMRDPFFVASSVSLVVGVVVFGFLAIFAMTDLQIIESLPFLYCPFKSRAVWVFNFLQITLILRLWDQVPVTHVKMVQHLHGEIGGYKICPDRPTESARTDYHFLIFIVVLIYFRQEMNSPSMSLCRVTLRNTDRV